MKKQKSKHGEPWQVHPWQGNLICDGDLRVKADALPKHSEECVINRERIIACVNACEGMEDPVAAIKMVKALLPECIRGAKAFGMPRIAQEMANALNELGA